MTKVRFLPHNIEAKASVGDTVFEILSNSNLDIMSICGGKTVCGKCKIEIVRGADFLNDVTTSEKTFLSEKEAQSGIRLACQTTFISPGEVEIYIPRTSRRAEQILQTEGLKADAEREVLVHKYFVNVKKPTLGNAKSDEDRVLSALKQQHSIDPCGLGFEFGVIRSLPIKLRESGGRVTAVIWRNKIIGIEKGDTSDRLFGFAVDVGTTKLAAYLMNLHTGQILSESAIMNPQINFGEDIISRITYVNEKGQQGLREAQKSVMQGINKLLKENCKESGVKLTEIYAYSLVGNTCMELLLLGVWPKYLALSPYISPIRRGINLHASELGLKGQKYANAYFPPIIGGFVGADNVAVLLSTKILDSEDVSMAIDIGTNTEIDIGNRRGIMAVSCASGPAFEGMHIKHGIRATPGAIERVSINLYNFDVDYLTIQNQEPIGICGSAMIDITAELFLNSLIDKSGRFRPVMEDQTTRLRKTKKGYEFVLVWKEETGIGRDIVFTQTDVREIQKAKAAIQAGASILMKKTGYSEEEIGKVFIAGAFGNSIDIENARTIGMYPEFAIEKVDFVGNAAGTGAKLCLASKESREKAEKIGWKAEYVELASDPEFQQEYINSLYLPHVYDKNYPDTRELLLRIQDKKQN